jgi:prepilin peptidase CpaA
MLTLDKWPVYFVCAGMILAAAIDGWKFKVPNWLTLPLIVGGWLLGLGYWWTGWVPDSNDSSNRFAASLICTAVGFGLLLPVYMIGGMGAGDVKMQMGFGAWIGAYYGTNVGAWIVLYGFCLGAMIGGVIGLCMMIGRFRQHFQTSVTILHEISASQGNIGQISEQAAKRRPHWVRLPYGIPLCIGFIGYLILWHIDGLPIGFQPTL